MRTSLRRIVAFVAIVLAVAPSLPLWAEGTLVPTESNIPPLRLKLHDVRVEIDNQLATTRVEQIFLNDATRQIEAIYTFPVPPGASISDFSLWIDGKETRGAIVEKEKAAAIYESIVRQAKDPGLLEHVDRNVFRVRVFPIPARGEQKIAITYSERIPYRAGLCAYRYPLMVKNVAGGNVGEFSLRAHVTSAIPIRSFESPTHKMDVIKRDDRDVIVTLNNASGPLNADFELRYTLKKEKTGFDIAWHRVPGEDGAFMMIVTPQMAIADDDIISKDMTFVFDTSGSMAGEKIDQAKEALAFCVRALRKGDRFNIITFGSDVVPFSREHLEATEENGKRALKFVDGITACGGTNIHDALIKALEHRAAGARPHMILLLTDGNPTQGETDPKAIVNNVIKKNTAGTRIFTFGVGEDLNRSLLDQIVGRTRAVAEYIGSGEAIAGKVTALNEKLSSPVMTQIAIDWGEADVHSLYPREIPDLYAHTQLTMVGRYKNHGNFIVRMTGKVRDADVVLEETVAFPEKREEGEEIARLWAMRKIGFLQEEIEANGRTGELIDEIVALSKKHRVATPYTSFLALEPEAARRMDVAQSGKVTIRPLADDPVEYQAEEPNHNEWSDPAEFKSRKESLDGVSDKPFERQGTYDRIGNTVGGSGGGWAYGGRVALKRVLDATDDNDPKTKALRSALAWLARNHHADGSWGEKGRELEATAYALLAFLGAGYTHVSKHEMDGVKSGEMMKKGLQWIISQQDAEGCIGPRKEDRDYLRDHLLCALVLAEAYGLTGNDLFKSPAQKAVDFAAASANPDGGWGCRPRDGKSNSIVTGLAVMLFRSAEVSGTLTVDRRHYAGAERWFAAVTDGQTHRVGFAAKADQGRMAGEDAKDHHPTATAAALIARMMIGKDRKAAPKEWAEIVSYGAPRWAPASDVAHWYLATLALLQYEGRTGTTWNTWRGAMEDVLVKNQSAANDATKGSWAPLIRSAEKGRCFATALNALTLELLIDPASTFPRGPR